MKWLWILCIILYIVNIVVVSVIGANLINNIVAWVMCISLALIIMLMDKENETNRNFYNDLLKTNRKLDTVRTILTLREIADKIGGNEIIDEKIAELEKELEE